MRQLSARGFDATFVRLLRVHVALLIVKGKSRGSIVYIHPDVAQILTAYLATRLETPGRARHAALRDNRSLRCSRLHRDERSPLSLNSNDCRSTRGG